MSDAMSLCPQVNREIVSGLKYVQQTFRKGMKSEWKNVCTNTVPLKISVTGWMQLLHVKLIMC